MKYRVKTCSATRQISEDYHVNSLMAKVIEDKGLSQNDYQKLINPRLIYHDFSLFTEGEMALDRIKEAIENKEKIVIYGDYDCDGILATSILVQAFHEMGIQVGFHIPNRFSDGYGLNVKRVEQMAEKGYTLIITVDNGIKAFEAVEKANSLGVDVIITDHHTFENDEYPDAEAIVHPKLGDTYPMKEICGGFIAYKLASALLGHHDPYLFSLAAITTISDMMPLFDENRCLVRRGLDFMKAKHYPQLDLLLGNQDYSTTAIGFTIAPKINAFGRLPEMVNPNNLVKYFQKDASMQFMQTLCEFAKKINSRRQSLTNTQYETALESEHEHCLYYASSDVHEGIVGLIAGKYTRSFEQPALVMHYDEEHHTYKGSARGVSGFNIYKFFKRHEDLLIQFGGHAMAGGFSVDDEHFEALHEALLTDIDGRDFSNEQNVIAITLDDLSLENVASLSLLEPYGQSNEEPKFLLKDTSFDSLRQLSEGKHLRFDRQLNDVRFAALYFFKGDQYENYLDRPLSLVGSLSINEYKGYKSINMIIDEIVNDEDLLYDEESSQDLS